MARRRLRAMDPNNPYPILKVHEIGEIHARVSARKTQAMFRRVLDKAESSIEAGNTSFSVLRLEDDDPGTFALLVSQYENAGWKASTGFPAADLAAQESGAGEQWWTFESEA